MTFLDLPDFPGVFPADTVFEGPHHDPKGLPLGTWRLMVNGRVFPFEITARNGTHVSAIFDTQEVRDGRWDESQNLLTFTRVVPDVIEQEFSAHVMAYSDQDPLWRMAGTFRTVRSLTGKSVPMIPSGWYGTLRR